MASRPELPAASATASLAARFQQARDFTVALTRPLATEDFVVQSMPDVSPAKWHLAHTSWFFENFLLQPHLPGYRVFHPQFGYLFNSYYYQVGQMHRRIERGLLSRPTVEEIFQYREHVDTAMHRLLGDTNDTVAALIELGIHHEQQHQELLLTDIKHVFSCNPLQPAYHAIPADDNSDAGTLRFIDGASGVQVIGTDSAEFHFDNESPAHSVYIAPHAIANRPISNAEYRQFIDDGGYQRSEFWLSQAWACVNEQQWQRPLYWDEDHRHEFTLGGRREINPQAPVSHVSYYEADAFARWAGYRLPTEAEWETWARQYALDGNFADSGRYHPVGMQAANGEAIVHGDVWQWTQSAYAAYPGYRPAHGAIGEYNGKFMCSQLVLRGGSCASSRSHLRATYRNFFYPADRWQFTGIRLAKDLS